MPNKRKSPWQAVDKDQLGYESNFNLTGEFHDGPRIAENDKIIAVADQQQHQEPPSGYR